MSCHFIHCCKFQNKCLWSLILYIFFHDLIHVYSHGAGADRSQGTKFWCQQKGLFTLPICCKFQRNLFAVWFYKKKVHDLIPEGKIFMSTETSCHFGHLLLVSNHRQYWFLKNLLFYFFPIQSIRDQTWPCRKTGQSQPRVISWTNLVVLMHQMPHTKFQGHWPFGSGEEDFLRFLSYMGMAAILVMWPAPSEQTFVPPSQGGSTWNLASIGLVVLEKMFENVDNTQTNGRQRPTYPISSPMSLWLKWAKNIHKIGENKAIFGLGMPPVTGEKLVK